MLVGELFTSLARPKFVLMAKRHHRDALLRKAARPTNIAAPGLLPLTYPRYSRVLRRLAPAMRTRVSICGNFAFLHGKAMRKHREAPTE